MPLPPEWAMTRRSPAHPSCGDLGSRDRSNAGRCRAAISGRIGLDLMLTFRAPDDQPNARAHSIAECHRRPPVRFQRRG